MLLYILCLAEVPVLNRSFISIFCQQSAPFVFSLSSFGASLILIDFDDDDAARIAFVCLFVAEIDDHAV